MIPVTRKLFAVTPPAAIVDNASFTTNVIDCKGFNFARIVVFIGALDIALTALKLQEADAASDATTLTSGADITDSVFGTAANDTGSTSTLPSATDDNKFFTFEVDLRGRKRYLKPVITMGDGSTGGFVCCFAELDRAEQVPTTATQKGVSQNMRIPNIT